MASLYDTDFATWADETARLLEEGRLDEIDIEALSEELHELGDSQREVIESQMTRLLLHLLKWVYAPTLDRERAGRAWRIAVNGARRDIVRKIRRSRKLASHPETILPDAYGDARKAARDALALPIHAFPDDCPWPLESILQDDWFPQDDEHPA